MKARTIALLKTTPAAMLITAAVIAVASVVQEQTGLRITVFTYFVAPALTALVGARQGFGSLVLTLMVLARFLIAPDRLPDYIPEQDMINIKAMVVALGLGLAGIVATIAFYRNRLEELMGQTRREARIDALTGASNRRHGQELLDQELDRAIRLHHPLSVILFDIDFFKSVNDNHGHLTGDRVLEEVVTVARTILRSYDVLVRWGGEEFLIVLPEASTTDAVRIAERLRLRISDHAFTHGESLTISAGVAGVIEDDDGDSLVARADTLLYRIKATGRNRIMGSPEGVVPAVPLHRLN